MLSEFFEDSLDLLIDKGFEGRQKKFSFGIATLFSVKARITIFELCVRGLKRNYRFSQFGKTDVKS